MTRNRRRGVAVTLAAGALAVGLSAVLAPDASAHDKWRGGWGHGWSHGWHDRDDDDWRGHWKKKRFHYRPPVYFAPPPVYYVPPPPVYYAPPPPRYYVPDPSIGFYFRF